MKTIKFGLLCLALSAVAGQTMAMSGPYEPVVPGGQNGPTASVPEPSSLAMIAAGIIGVVVARRFSK